MLRAFRQVEFPAAVQGLTVWFRADKGLDPTDGSTVKVWKSYVPYGTKAGTDATTDLHNVGATGPTYAVGQKNPNNSLVQDSNANAFNGWPAVYSPATNMWMSSSTWTTSLAQPSTWYAVGRVSGGGAIFGGHSTAYQAVSENWNGSGEWDLSTHLTNFVPTTLANGTNHHVVCGVFNGASSAAYSDDSQAALGTGTLDADGQTLMTLFNQSDASAPASFATIDSAEILGYSGAHSAATRRQIMRWLGQKYGLSAVT